MRFWKAAEVFSPSNMEKIASQPNPANVPPTAIAGLNNHWFPSKTAENETLINLKGGRYLKDHPI